MTATPGTQVESPLAQSVSALRGVGPERASQLARLGILTVEDLLLHRPRRYEDRRDFVPIDALQLDEPATTRGTVVGMGVNRYRRGQKSVFELILDDGTARLRCRWWNLPFMQKYFAVGDEVVVFGKPLSLKPRTMDHPEIEVVESDEENFIHLNRITPVYPLTEGLPQRWLRTLIWRTLQQFGSQIPDPWPAYELNSVSARSPVRTRAACFRDDGAGLLTSRSSAVRLLHFPDKPSDIEVARRRLALDEFVELQRQFQLRRANFESRSKALPCGGDNRMVKPFLAGLGFKLTAAQTRVLREIRGDMKGAHPMRRLLQGDVGSGKTVVAACAALMAIESGYRVALMAPTEILAEQHFRTFEAWFGPLGLVVELRTGGRKTTANEQRRLSADRHGAHIPSVSSRLEFRSAALFIGTHALIESGFEPEALGLVIIDEQHRFGVSQREQLVRKGAYPHLLIMTATPIPRTLGLTVYGDLDNSILDTLPPGRGRIHTYVRTADSLPKVWSFIREKLCDGRQAYVVYPRVEESGRDGVKAVTKELASLEKMLAPFRVGLLHGRLKARERETVMAGFRSNSVHVLLATSLIEVGVDVPNATVMLIENAELFGLAQLHQLRGRIGRSAQDGYCILISSTDNEEAQPRLRVLEGTTDGFQIADADLKFRGPGELLGQQQSGLPEFLFGDLGSDWALIQLARRIVGPSRV